MKVLYILVKNHIIFAWGVTRVTPYPTKILRIIHRYKEDSLLPLTDGRRKAGNKLMTLLGDKKSPTHFLGKLHQSEKGPEAENSQYNLKDITKNDKGT